MNVLAFSYDGLFVRPSNQSVNYTAEFIKWTNDPGIAECSCSDGKIRNIPTCMLQGFDVSKYPKQVYPKIQPGVVFVLGQPSHS